MAFYLPLIAHEHAHYVKSDDKHGPSHGCRTEKNMYMLLHNWPYLAEENKQSVFQPNTEIIRKKEHSFPISSASRELVYNGHHFKRCPTKGDGLCAIHALLGEERNGMLQWNGTREDLAKKLEIEKGKRAPSFFRPFFHGLLQTEGQNEYDTRLKEILKAPLEGVKNKIDKRKYPSTLKEERLKILKPLVQDVIEKDAHLKEEFDNFYQDGNKRVDLMEAIGVHFDVKILPWLKKKKEHPDIQQCVVNLQTIENQYKAIEAEIDRELDSFISDWFMQYLEIFKESDYFLTHHELEMVAAHYNKKVLVLTQDRLCQDPGSVEEDTIVI